MQRWHVIITAPPTQLGLPWELAFSKDRQVSGSACATCSALSYQCSSVVKQWYCDFYLEMFGLPFPYGHIDCTIISGFGCLKGWNISPQGSWD